MYIRASAQHPITFHLGFEIIQCGRMKKIILRTIPSQSLKYAQIHMCRTKWACNTLSILQRNGILIETESPRHKYSMGGRRKAKCLRWIILRTAAQLLGQSERRLQCNAASATRRRSLEARRSLEGDCHPLQGAQRPRSKCRILLFRYQVP